MSKQSEEQMIAEPRAEVAQLEAENKSLQDEMLLRSYARSCPDA